MSIRGAAGAGIGRHERQELKSYLRTVRLPIPDDDVLDAIERMVVIPLQAQRQDDWDDFESEAVAMIQDNLDAANRMITRASEALDCVLDIEGVPEAAVEQIQKVIERLSC